MPLPPLSPSYWTKVAARGDGSKVPAEYADVTKARLYYRLKDGTMVVEHYNNPKHCYNLYLCLPRGFRAAMRNANETLPVYGHSLVDVK